MAQWINLWYNSFVNRWLLPSLCEKIGATVLALLDFTASWQADKLVPNSEIFKII